MKNLSLLTWKEIQDIDKSNSVLFVTMAPIEQHSLCLPIATDVIEGEHWSKEAMARLEEREQYSCFYLPTFPIAAASVDTFYGNIHFSMKTTYWVAIELLDNLVHMGFKHIVIIASHGDPEHQITIEKAVEKVNKHYGVKAISPMGAFFSMNELQIKHSVPKKILDMEKEQENDFHAGWIETSSMLAIAQSLVHKEYTKLPMTSIADKEMISKKKQRRAMGEYGHIGNPAVAEKSIGELLNEDVAEFIYEAVKCFVKREGYKVYMHHFLYRIPFLHLGVMKRRRWKKVTI